MSLKALNSVEMDLNNKTEGQCGNIAGHSVEQDFTQCKVKDVDSQRALNRHKVPQTLS